LNPQTCPLRSAAKRWGSAPAWIDADSVHSWADWDAAADRMARALDDHELSVGDRVATQYDNSYALATLFFAGWRRGLVMCPISTRFPKATTRALCDAIDATALITDGLEISHLHAIPLHTLTRHEDQDPTGAAIASIPDDRLATILFTSGSTGLPKAICHRLSSHLHSAKASNDNLPFGPEDRWLLSLSLCHIGGLAILIRAALGGGAIVSPQRHASLDSAILTYGTTHVSVVATQLSRLISAMPNAPDHLQGVLAGGGPIPAALLQTAFEGGYPLLSTYGATETGSQVCTTPPRSPLEHLSSAGAPLDGWEVRVGTNDEILVRGAALLAGHWISGALQPAVTKDGWFPTGDVGRWTDDGRLVIAGRLDQMFISGGENIHPEEIEQILLAFPGVVQTLVIPVADGIYGERPAAFIRWLDDGQSDEGGLRRWAERQLPRFKLPTHYLSWPKDIRGTDWKISRAEFGQRARDALA